MTNTYFKMLNNSIQENFTNKIITDVQNSVRKNIELKKPDNLDIYDMVKNLENSSSFSKDIDINTLLKYYVLNQIIKDSKTNLNSQEEVFKNTPNLNIKFNSKDKKYYQLIDNTFVKNEKIETVDEIGNYTIIEAKNSYSYKIKKVFDINDNILSLQVINPLGNVESCKLHAIEILGMKKVLTQKHKYTGYSGNSSDLMATILNKFCNPIETGYYMDKTYKIYLWSEPQKCFIRNFTVESKSPLLTDYEFTNEFVIRKEYTGSVK